MQKMRHALDADKTGFDAKMKHAQAVLPARVIVSG
jgi:hypothetical protein